MTSAAGEHPRWLDPLSQSLAALPAPPKGGSFIRADLQKTSSPLGGAGERSEPERVGVLSAKPSGFD